MTSNKNSTIELQMDFLAEHEVIALLDWEVELVSGGAATVNVV